jgi:hypothetical protein
MPSISDFYEQEGQLSRTLFTIVGDEFVEPILAATTRTVGDLNKPQTGIMTVLPVEAVHGLIEYGKGS